jgi:hypothetical protein
MMNLQCFFFNFVTTNPRHKIHGKFKNFYFVLFTVVSLEKLFEYLLLQCNLGDFNLLLSNFENFWSSGRPCFQILKSNHFFFFFPSAGPTCQPFNFLLLLSPAPVERAEAPCHVAVPHRPAKP